MSQFFVSLAALVFLLWACNFYAGEPTLHDVDTEAPRYVSVPLMSSVDFDQVKLDTPLRYRVEFPRQPAFVIDAASWNADDTDLAHYVFFHQVIQPSVDDDFDPFNHQDLADLVGS